MTWLNRLRRTPPAWTLNTDPRTHDWTGYTGWGHALHGFEPIEPGSDVLSGSCHSMHPIRPGDLMRWTTPYGSALGRIEEVRWCGDPDDMYHLDAVRVVSRRVTSMPDHPVGTVLPLPPLCTEFNVPGWEEAGHGTVTRVR